MLDSGPVTKGVVKMNIMVVDDDPFVRETIQPLLKFDGWLDESPPATYNRISSGGDPSPPGAIGQAAALQRRSTPSSGRQGQVDWTKRPRPLCQHRYPRYCSGLAPSLDCQEIRFEQETQTRSPADQSGHSRTGPANGTGKSVMGLHAHPRCPGQSATRGRARHYREHFARSRPGSSARPAQGNDLEGISQSSLEHDGGDGFLHRRSVDACGIGALSRALRDALDDAGNPHCWNRPRALRNVDVTD